VKGAQLKNFRSGTLWLLTLQPSLPFPKDQLPEATGHSNGLSGLRKCKDSFIYFLTHGSKHSATTSAPASFCQEMEAKIWCYLDTALGVVVMFENFWLGSPGSWHHCPSSCILSSRMKPGWSGNGYRKKFWSNWEKKILKWSHLQHWCPGFLFETSHNRRKAFSMFVSWTLGHEHMVSFFQGELWQSQKPATSWKNSGKLLELMGFSQFGGAMLETV